MLPAPFLPSPPLPNDHFIHAKVLRQLSQDRMQEVVRSVVAKKFANLKSLKDFMSRQQHQSRERESNYPNCKKACGVFVCVSYLSCAHVKNAKFFQRVLQAQ
jgi:hypothetical protein